MCGIVGYLGEQNSPREVIINGLKKLEYRGYDSAGIAVIQNSGELKRVRAQGKLTELEKALEYEPIQEGHIGIGHTRWATHGVPSERNAHPHHAGKVSLVHNGIIENYLEIREQLLEAGVKIESDTDSELVAHLISREVEKTKSIFSAVKNVKPQLKGAYSILVLWEESPNELIAFKDGPPLVIGIGEGETYLASDVQALLNYTQKFIYINDQELVHVQFSKVQKQPSTANFTTETSKLSKEEQLYHVSKVTLYNQRFEKIEPKVATINWSADLIEKQGYAHYMLKEIYEQPRAVAQAAAPHIDLEKMEVQLDKVGFDINNLMDLEKLDSKKDFQSTLEVFKNIQKVYIIACGTSYYAGQVAKYFIEKNARINVETDIASEFRYRNPILSANELVVTISQSGETADTLAAIRLAKNLGAKTLSICNVKNSSIDREAHGHLYMNSGPEIGVASTKAFVSSLVILNLLSLALGKAKKVLNHDDEVIFLRAILGLPSQMEGILAYDKYFSEAAQKLKKFKGFLYLGRGVSFPIAMEGALKLKELAYMHAEGYAAGEMKHGPLALIDPQMAIVMLAPQDDVYEKTISNLEEARARGGKIISISTGENTQLQKVSEYYLSLPKAHWSVNPMLAVVPLQLMAYHLASALNHDVDQPRNLAKSVTVE